ncbi:hypothetical protein HN011_008703, partial [Eciton burchellii]
MDLFNKLGFLQASDPVQVQIDSAYHACNIIVVRKKRRAISRYDERPHSSFGFFVCEVDE